MPGCKMRYGRRMSTITRWAEGVARSGAPGEPYAIATAMAKKGYKPHYPRHKHRSVLEMLGDPTAVVSNAIEEASGTGEKWITIRGNHVLVNSRGDILAGPPALVKQLGDEGKSVAYYGSEKVKGYELLGHRARKSLGMSRLKRMSKIPESSAGPVADLRNLIRTEDMKYFRPNAEKTILAAGPSSHLAVKSERDFAIIRRSISEPSFRSHGKPRTRAEVLGAESFNYHPISVIRALSDVLPSGIKVKDIPKDVMPRLTRKDYGARCRKFGAWLDKKLPKNLRLSRGNRPIEESSDGGRWITIKGSHVYVGPKGEIQKGPRVLVQAPPKEELSDEFIKSFSQRYKVNGSPQPDSSFPPVESVTSVMKPTISASDAGKGRFNWKIPRGSYTARFGFSDEARGERFFDSNFTIGPGSTKGFIKVGMQVDYRGRPSRTAEAAGIDKALKVGTRLSISPTKFTTRGSRAERSINVVIKKVGRAENGWLGVAYDEV